MLHDMALRPAPFTFLELCAGSGGLGLAIKLAVPGARCVGYVERDAGAAAILVTRMEAGDLASAPIWSDLASFDGRPWRGRVHCVASGDPCQPNSVAGKRGGVDDDRFLIEHVARIVDEVRPDRFFRENVTGNADGQISVLVPLLERMGRRVAAGIWSSKGSGNSHGRERLFVMADLIVADAGRGLEQPTAGDGAGSGEAPSSRTPSQPAGRGDVLGNSPGRAGRLPTGQGRPDEGESDARGRGGDLGDADHERQQERFRQQSAEPTARGSTPIGASAVVGDATDDGLQWTELAAAEKRPPRSAGGCVGQLSAGLEGPSAELADAFGDADRGANVTRDVRPAAGVAEREARLAHGKRGGPRLGDGSEDVADAGDARLQGDQFDRACDDEQHWSDAHGSVAELRRAWRPLRAPSPNDPVWAAVLDANPLLAPAIGNIDQWAIARRAAGLPPLGGTVGRRGGMARDLDAATKARLKSLVRRVADALAGRVDRLRNLGNGVDPVAGCDAWVHLDALHAAERERAAGQSFLGMEP